MCLSESRWFYLSMLAAPVLADMQGRQALPVSDYPVLPLAALPPALPPGLHRGTLQGYITLIHPGAALRRATMVRLALLEPRVSVLEDDFDEDALEQEAGKAAAAAVRAPTPCPLHVLCLRSACLVRG